MMQQIKKVIFYVIFLACSLSTMRASHNTSRYFPFLEKTSNYVIGRRSHINPEYFYTTASTSIRRGGGTGGIPELWGRYDLKDVINSLKVVRAAQGITVDPVKEVTGSDEFDGKSAIFHVSGKVKSQGLILDYEQDLHWGGFSVGFWLPLMDVGTSNRFSFRRDLSDPYFSNPTLPARAQAQQILVLDQIRRLTHQEICFKGNEWRKGGFGDLDMHLRWSYYKDHVMLMRSIDVNILGGVVAPTGVLSNINYPSSVSFMGNGHWTLYLDLVPEFELKQDWKLGLILGFMHQFKHTRTLRIPVTKEPAIFSALVGRVEIDPGSTFKASPYFTLENLTDGLHFQVRYTYLRHRKDTWIDKRPDTSVQSYLQKDCTIIAMKRNLSQFRSHYVTLQLTYDAKEAMKKWFMNPYLYVAYDMPIGGDAIAQTHQLSIGAELHF